MNHLLGISRSGMHALQYGMDTVANDIANVNTTGYKSRHATFESLMANVQASENAGNVEVSSGARSEDYQINFQQGSFVESLGDYQFAINGEGFFRLTDTEGNEFYTRDGNFQLNQNGQVTNARNEQLFMINGEVPLFQPMNPDEMIPVGENKFTVQGGVEPAEGSVITGYLENANADLATLFSEMMVLQRAYSLNIRAAQSTDEMMSGINQFKQ